MRSVELPEHLWAGNTHRSSRLERSGEGVILDIILGIVGAVFGGWVFPRFGAAGVTGLNLYSLLVAVVGSVLLLFIYHAIRRV
jgi:uncharacterized membrane protein YeaQ/YmgE (transglycosylase-associated protein family)